MEEKEIIRVKDLNFWYGDHQALREVSLSVNEHRVTAIIGPSGCGKSTFLKTLNRMYETIPEARVEGKALFRGENILAKDVDVYNLRKQIGMVFQKPNPFPKSIYENVAYGLRINRMNSNIDQKVQEALSRAALWDEVKDKLKTSGLELSGGQQQRLCIARALAINPEVLLMDEPASALDPIATAKIEDLIDELKKDYTVIIVTHNMQQAARISDITGVFLTGGKLVEMDKTEKIFENPANKRVEDYITGKFG